MTQPLARAGGARARSLLTLVGVLILSVVLVSMATAATPSTTDPRAALSPGLTNAGVAAIGVELLANRPKSAGFFDPNNAGSISFANSDAALQGDYAFIGNFNGFQIYNIADPANPVLRTAVVCPGGQGDLSVYQNLLFMSVEETRGRTDCGAPSAPSGSPLRFRGVRIFDISNLDAPVQVAAVQTCRGSHTHTLLKSPSDNENLYIYVSGTAGVRSATELASCHDVSTPGPAADIPLFDETISRWRIEVIKVPLAAPQTASVVSTPRLMRNPATGQINGLQNTIPTPQHPSGTNWAPSPTTDSCHDITMFPSIGLAAGACEGNGILIDIRDPANPVRIDAVADLNYAYWHGATFSNDGKTVMFTDEWGGGTSARCRATDDLSWGANAIFDIVDNKLVFRSYYKLPVAQVNQENCVGHIPSIVPVPGRDIAVQAWYQGGVSLVDFTDSANPKEIGYYDRGPISATSLVLGGLWSTYYYNGAVYGTEIARGLDSWKLTPTAELSVNEIKAASEVKLDRLNVQMQPVMTAAPSFAVVRSHLDQLVRANGIDQQALTQSNKFISNAEDFAARNKPVPAAANLRALAKRLEPGKHDTTDPYKALREAVLALEATFDD
jgi:LVIVD repeat